MGFGLRLFRLSHKPFWQDEGVTWFIGNGILSSDAHPGFYFYLLEKSLHYFGNDEFAGRLLSAVCGALTVLFIYYLARFIFNHKTALLASLFVAISPYAIAVSQEMRMYSLIGLEFVLLLIAFWQVLPSERTSRKTLLWWFCLFIVGLAGLNTHAILNFQLVFLTVVFVLFNWRRTPKRLLNWGVLLLAWGIAFLPSLLHMASIVHTRKHIWVTMLPGEILINITFMIKSWIIMITGDLFGLFLLKLKLLPLTLIILLIGSLLTLLAAAVYILIRYFKLFTDKAAAAERRSVTVLLLLITFNIILFLSLEVSSPNHLIPLFVLMVLTVVFLLMRVKKLWRNLAYAIVLILVSISVIDYYKAPYFYFDAVNWSSVSHDFSNKCSADDVIIVFGNRNVFYTLKYYGSGIPCPMYYIKTSKWPEDPFQIAPDFEKNPYPVKLISNYLEDYPRVWCIVHEKWVGDIVTSPEFKVEKSRFKKIPVYLLSITKSGLN